MWGLQSGCLYRGFGFYSCLDCMEDVLLVVGGGIGPRGCKEQCRTFEVFPLSIKALTWSSPMNFPPFLEGQGGT